MSKKCFESVNHTLSTYLVNKLNSYELLTILKAAKKIFLFCFNFINKSERGFTYNNVICFGGEKRPLKAGFGITRPSPRRPLVYTVLLYSRKSYFAITQYINVSLYHFGSSVPPLNPKFRIYSGQKIGLLATTTI